MHRREHVVGLQLMARDPLTAHARDELGIPEITPSRPVQAALSSAVMFSVGAVILQQNCGRCHAIETTGESPLKQAPPMRDIYARFVPRELQAELREGMVSKHRAMPQIDFSDGDVDAMLAYLYALAIKK
jgi:mono/diheme cytochrome c family protein